MTTCTCGSDDAGGGPEDHARDCRIRTGFTPNGTDGTPDPPDRYIDARQRGKRQRSRHRRESWAGLRRRLASRGVVRATLDVIGLASFVVMGGMLHPIAGVAIFGAACIAYSWRLDDDR